MRFSSFAIVVLIGIFASISSACVNNPSPDLKKYIVKDSIIITTIESSNVVHDTMIVFDSVLIQDFIIDNSSTFICLRHAEAESGMENPMLLPSGMERADLLRDLMTFIPLSAIYSTDFNRTRLTAKPTAEDQNLTIQFYEKLDLANFSEEILEKNDQKISLVVGHSDSTPSFMNHLVNKDVFDSMSSDEFGNLYIVSIFGEGKAKITHLCYGD